MPRCCTRRDRSPSVSYSASVHGSKSEAISRQSLPFVILTRGRLTSRRHSCDAARGEDTFRRVFSRVWGTRFSFVLRDTRLSKRTVNLHERRPANAVNVDAAIRRLGKAISTPIQTEWHTRTIVIIPGKHAAGDFIIGASHLRRISSFDVTRFVKKFLIGRCRRVCAEREIANCNGDARWGKQTILSRFPTRARELHGDGDVSDMWTMGTYVFIFFYNISVNTFPTMYNWAKSAKGESEWSAYIFLLLF